MKRLVLALALILVAPIAYAQQLMGSYNAYIGNQDLYNSNGVRLMEPWQVLRQERANYHRFGISQYGDEWDPFFGNINNRAVLEQMVRNSYIAPNVRSMILQGGARIHVQVYGVNGFIQSINVSVAP